MDNVTIYKSWFEDHAKKHQKIIRKLSHLSNEAIIEYFDFENMLQNEPDFCPLYKTKEKCHNVEKLNCYLCACPLFRVADTKSYCSIDAKEGSSICADDGYIHQDCSKCAIPHSTQYVKKNFSKNWRKIMEKSLP